MEIRFECDCYERTLVISIPTKYRHLEEEIVKNLDQYYNEWIFFETEEAEDMCLEEYMLYKLTEQYDVSLAWHVEEN
jgi:hypothetical protein